MDLIFGKDIITKAINNAQKDDNKELVNQIINSEINEPITTNKYIAKNTEIKQLDINNTFESVFLDLNIINNQVITGIDKVEEIIKTSINKFNDIEKILLTEKERQEDLNMLCGDASEFKSLVAINDVNSHGSYSYVDGVFSLKKRSDENIKYEVSSISGNGYEGNKYVYADEKFKEDFTKTSNRAFINDADDMTYYEYSRVTVNNEEKIITEDFNTDSLYAQCSITITSKSEFNSLELSSKATVLVVGNSIIPLPYI